MENNQYKPMSIGDWMITYLCMCIPLVNIILLFVWALSDSSQPSKKSWAQATLIFYAIMIVLYMMFFAVIMSSYM